jgi:hypothetical protein
MLQLRRIIIIIVTFLYARQFDKILKLIFLWNLSNFDELVEEEVKIKRKLEFGGRLQHKYLYNTIAAHGHFLSMPTI